MKRLFVQTRSFSADIDDLISHKKLSKEDYEAFEKRLMENPEEGDVIPGTGGLRKTRLKSATKGKSGGFRVCYLDCKETAKIFLILIYGKNEMENISQKDKGVLKSLVETIKRNELYGKT